MTSGSILGIVVPDCAGRWRPTGRCWPASWAGFTAAVAALAADPEKRAMFGVAGRAAVAGRSWAAVGDELIGHYRAALAAAAVPARDVAVAA